MTKINHSDYFSATQADINHFNNDKLKLLAQIIPLEHIVRRNYDNINYTLSVRLSFDGDFTNYLELPANDDPRGEERLASDNLGGVTIESDNASDDCDCFIINDIEQAIELHINLNVLNHSHRIIIAPTELFYKMVTETAKQREVTIFCDMLNEKATTQDYKGHNVRLVSLENPDYNETLTNVGYKSFGEFLADKDYVKSVSNLQWNNKLGKLRDDIKQTAQPFPIDCFPSIIKNAILAIHEHSQASIQISTMSVLAALTAIAQPKVSARFIFSTKPVSLFLLTEGETGAGKTQSFEFSYKSIREYIINAELDYDSKLDEHLAQLANFKSPQERAEFLKENPTPIHPDFIVEDSTIEALFNKFVVEGHKDLVWQSDDAGIILGGHSFKSQQQGNVIGSLTKVWSSQIATRNRLDGNEKKKQRWCNLTLDLMGQNVILEPLLADPLYQGQGFLSRFIFMKSEDNRGYRKFNDIERLTNESPYLDRRLLEYWQLCDDLLDPIPTRYPRQTDPAQDHRFIIEYDSIEVMKFHADYQQRCEDLQQKGQLYEYSKDIANRMAENACKLATIFAFFDKRLSTTIPDYEKAICIIDYCMNERMRYFKEIQTISKTEPELMVDWLVKWCKDNKTSQIGKRELMQKLTPKPLRKKDIFWDNVNYLVEQNYIRINDEKTIEINPILLN